jgi:hypothetical protein
MTNIQHNIIIGLMYHADIARKNKVLTSEKTEYMVTKLPVLTSVIANKSKKRQQMKLAIYIVT